MPVTPLTTADASATVRVPFRTSSDAPSVESTVRSLMFAIGSAAARTISGHEKDLCPLDHPLVGALRCGEWLLYSGVHDLMHLEQLEALEASLARVR